MRIFTLKNPAHNEPITSPNPVITLFSLVNTPHTFILYSLSTHNILKYNAATGMLSNYGLKNFDLQYPTRPELQLPMHNTMLN